MSEYSLKLKNFEGPLDLLMHLIEKNEIDIYDIPIAQVTEQYLAYLTAMEEFDMEVASEFLVMAATLLQIKSRMLLPKIANAAVEEPEEDPRKELVDRLLEYRRFKQAVSLFETMMDERAQVASRLPMEFKAVAPSLPVGLNLDSLLRAIAAVWESSIDDYAVITREEISIQDKIQDILHLARANGGQIEFQKIMIRTGTRSEVIAAFLALLELIRLKRIAIRQTQNFGPIYLMLKE